MSVAVVLVAFEGVAPVSQATDAQAGTVFGSGVWFEVPVDAPTDFILGMLNDMLVCTVNGVVPEIVFLADVDADMWVIVMAVLDFITLSVSLEELLLFCCV